MSNLDGSPMTWSAEDERISQRLKALANENARLREALQFYADEEKWTDNDMQRWDNFDCTTIGQDLGDVAREALQGEEV